MLVIPMWQPHASAVALGLKKIETRGFAIKYRGPVAIHAAKKWDGEIRKALATIPFNVLAQLEAPTAVHWGKPFLPLGQIIAVADLIDCQSTTPWPETQTTTREFIFIKHPALDTPIERALGNYEPGRFGWVLSNVRALPEPINYKAHQGCYLLDQATTARALEQADAPGGRE